MSSTIRIQIGGGGGGGRTQTRTRYSRGWRAGDQDRKPVTRAARVAVQGRSFQAIRDECLSKGMLWEDPDFPASDKSLFYSQFPPGNIEWKRPGEICENPRMIVETVSRFDVKQGDLGNCWFLAAVASLCASCNRKHGNKDILYKVVPLDNSFVQGYAGVFHFKIWQYGQWVDVLVDDRLPTMAGRLVYMHSAENNEFWSALLEKAYAKLNGSYEALRGGSSCEAMEDFTGGICEIFNMTKDVPKDFGKIMLKAHERHSLMACQIDATAQSIESVLPNGLVIGHAYSITSVIKINVYGTDTILVRLRNPWGNQYEWKGAWGDGSSEWNMLTEADRQKHGITFDDDGEFWMSLSDFMSNYHRVEICNLSPDNMEGENESTEEKRWESSVQDGSWKRKVNAGGCRNFLDTYWTNPQYRVEVVDADEGHEENKGTLIVGLMQKERRKKRQEGLDYLTIGYSVYKLPDKDCGPLDLNFFKYNRTVARSTYTNMREVCQRFELEPGHYAIIPSTFKPDQEGDFIVRTYSERPNNSEELDEKTGQDEEDTDELSSMFRTTIRTSTGDGGWTVIKTSSSQDDGPHSGVWTGQWKSENPGDIDSLTKKLEEEMRKSMIGPESGGASESQPQDSSTVEPGEKRDAIRRRMRTRQVTDDDVSEERKVRELFKQMAGEDRELDAYEVRELLNQTFMKEFSFDGFSLETCRSIVAMKDLDKSGKLEYEEFKKMWAGLRQWKKIFKEFDQDKSGTFNSFELRQALNSAGIHVSNSTFNGLVMRYSDQRGRIFFDDFVLCAVRLRTMFAIFKDTQEDGKSSFDLDEFIQTTMYS